MQQHGGNRIVSLVSLLRRCGPLLLAPVLAFPLWWAPMPALAAPATEAEMDLYTRIAAVNVCIARAAGVDFDKAVAIAGETVAQLIQGMHAGAISQVGPKPLSLEDLRKGSVNSAVLGAAEVCPKEVPAEVLSKVDEALKEAGNAAAPAATPAAAPAPAAEAAPAKSARPKPTRN